MTSPKRRPAQSAQQVDPLSWFSGPLLPLVLAGIAFVYSMTLVVAFWGISERPWLQLIAVLLCSSPGLIIQVAARPLRRQNGGILAVVGVVPAGVGMLVSAVDYAGTALPIELWWAPGTLALALASLGPFLSSRSILTTGAVAIVVTALSSVAVLHSPDHDWGVLGTGLIIAYPALLALTSTVVFAHIVVTSMRRMLDERSRSLAPEQTFRDEAAAQFERDTVAQLSSRAVPFLHSIIDRGRVSPADRALAGQLARRLRDDLVTESRLSWLDSIAGDSRLVIVDPDHLAKRMSSPQRTALRGMLRAILDTPGTDSGSLMVDLRHGPDGTTAVGVSLDIALPEGRRTMHLAPYYLALRTTVSDLTIDTRDPLTLSFRVDGDASCS